MAADLYRWLRRIFWRSWLEDLVERVLDELLPPGRRLLPIKRVPEASGMAGQTTPAPDQLRAVRKAVARSRRRRVRLDEFMEDTSVAWREYAVDHGLPGQLILKGVAIDHLDETLARLEGRRS
ncbi:MAG: hypothetical protein OXI49_13210 [Acidobacteriota bacterium]|nr:hypothetical protein [Acidobacteriota bacterium]